MVMEREELERRFAAGQSLEAIAREVGKHASTVGYWARKYGLDVPRAAKHGPRGGLDREVLAELVESGLTLRQIAAEVDRSTATVQHWLREFGLATVRARRDVVAGEDGARGRGLCPVHGEVEFVRRAEGAWRCVACRSEAVMQRRRRLKEIIVAEAGGACAICGYARSVAALQFHHLEPAEKRFAIAGRGMTRSLEALREEAAKCVLLCANCHAEVEAGVTQAPAKLPRHHADHPA
jgi:transposase